MVFLFGPTNELQTFNKQIIRASFKHVLNLQIKLHINNKIQKRSIVFRRYLIATMHYVLHLVYQTHHYFIWQIQNVFFDIQSCQLKAPFDSLYLFLFDSLYCDQTNALLSQNVYFWILLVNLFYFLHKVNLSIFGKKEA